MMACEAIASSSLSALILAEALGIPNLWLDFGAEDAERAFEFQDWFSLADKPQSAPLRPVAAAAGERSGRRVGAARHENRRARAAHRAAARGAG